MAPAALVLLAACTASWHALVRYSAEPALPGEPLAVGVYTAVLSTEADSSTPITPESDSVAPSPLVYSTAASYFRPPSYWADTLKTEVSAALRDPAIRFAASHDDVAAAARQLGIPIADDRHARTVAAPEGSFSVYLSHPGFNHDSTIAAIRISVTCGRLCGHGAMLLLARRPGFRWRVWQTWLVWIS